VTQMLKQPVTQVVQVVTQPVAQVLLRPLGV
jgi:hypothetical protein